MTREEPLYVPVEDKGDDVHCPECNEKATKKNFPNYSKLDQPKSGNATGMTGHAYCDNADCPVGKENEIIDWSYRTDDSTYRVTDVPKACDGEVFQNSPPDKEPDGESES